MTALVGWLLFLLAISVLLNFINLVLWRDDRAVRDWYQESWQWESDQHDETVRLLADAQMDRDESEYLMAFALEQLYAKATLQEAMEGACIIVVSDVDLQALAADKGPDASFTFDRLVAASLQDDDEEDMGL